MASCISPPSGRFRRLEIRISVSDDIEASDGLTSEQKAEALEVSKAKEIAIMRWSAHNGSCNRSHDNRGDVSARLASSATSRCRCAAPPCCALGRVHDASTPPAAQVLLGGGAASYVALRKDEVGDGARRLVGKTAVTAADKAREYEREQQLTAKSAAKAKEVASQAWAELKKSLE